jgi:hypothetical protein
MTVESIAAEIANLQTGVDDVASFRTALVALINS